MTFDKSGGTAPVCAEAVCRADLAMARYANGERAAFAELFLELAPRLLAFLRRSTGSVALADDLLQETFVRIHHARASFVPGKPVAQWAHAIARNVFLSQRRSAHAKLERASEGLSALEQVAASEGTGEQQVLARETARILDRALSGMTRARRETFLLLRQEGSSVSSVAKRIGASEGAVKIRAFRARGLLRQALAERATGERRPSLACGRGGPTPAEPRRRSVA